MATTTTKAKRDHDFLGIESTHVFINADNQRLYRHEWVPKNAPKALVFLSHGLNDYCLRYAEMAERLSQNDLFVFGHDHVGNGRSEGARVYIDDFGIFVRDVVADIHETRKSFPQELPIFILGISMGGAIAIQTARKYPELLRGVVLAAPAIVIDPDTATPFKIWLAETVSHYFPNFGVGRLDLNLISRKKETVDFVRNDPLAYKGSLKARMATSLLHAIRDIETHMHEITFPLLFLQGIDDKVCHPQGARLLAKEAPSQDKTVLMYEGMYHALYQELPEDTERVMTDTLEWILQRVDNKTLQANVFVEKPSLSVVKKSEIKSRSENV